MSANIQFAGPFIKEFVHANATTSGTANTATTVLAIAPTGTRRAQVMIQNKSSSASIEVIFNEAGSAGMILPPLGSIGMTNYNGAVRVVSATTSVPIHIAYAVA